MLTGFQLKHSSCLPVSGG